MPIEDAFNIGAQHDSPIAVRIDNQRKSTVPLRIRLRYWDFFSSVGLHQCSYLSSSSANVIGSTEAPTAVTVAHAVAFEPDYI
jgi:hypothetical protein